MYIVDERQYFDEDIVQLQDGEAFVDAGSLDLGTTRIFMEKMKQKGCAVEKVWAFEPDDSNYCDCEKALIEKGMEKVELMKMGLWCRNTNLAFQCDELAGSHIVESDEGGTQVKVVALDSCVQEKVTFIKMDIEGAEYEALKGAERLIRKYKPKLAVSIYHKPEDIWEIPGVILNIHPGYKLYLRHYSIAAAETVVYAI